MPGTERFGAGTAIITANINGTKVTCEVKVLKIQYNELELKKGDNFTLEILGTNSNIVWHSYKKSVVTVSDDGIVTAVSPGTGKIVAEVDGRLVRCIVTVR